MQKSDIRKLMMKRRKALSKNDVARMSHVIARRLDESVDWLTTGRLHIYDSCGSWNEVVTKNIPSELTRRYPLLSISVGQSTKDAALPDQSFDVIIVPLLAFDASLHRIGFGGGWYDRFLADNPGALKIGLAYNFQRVYLVPASVHDIPLDMIITETATITK